MQLAFLLAVLIEKFNLIKNTLLNKNDESRHDNKKSLICKSGNQKAI